MITRPLIRTWKRMKHRSDSSNRSRGTQARYGSSEKGDSMKDSSKTGRRESRLAYFKLVRELRKQMDFVRDVPLDKPVRLYLEYQIENFAPSIEEYVVLVQNFETYESHKSFVKFTTKVECRLLAEKKNYIGSIFSRGSGYYFSFNTINLQDWELIPDKEAPLFLREHPFVEEEF